MKQKDQVESCSLDQRGSSGSNERQFLDVF